VPKNDRISIFYSKHFATLLKSSKHVRSTFTMATAAAVAAEVSFSFGLLLKTYKCNPVMMFAPSMTSRLCVLSFPSPLCSGLLTDCEMYSKSCQFSPGNSISSKNDPLSLLLPTLLVSSFTPSPRPSNRREKRRTGKALKPPRDFFR